MPSVSFCALDELVFKPPIKHISRKNQWIFEVGLANHLILLAPKFLSADEAKKTWCGKYLIILKKNFYFIDSYGK
jgi:hypothetical protein